MKFLVTQLLLVTLLVLFIIDHAIAQDPLRFEHEVSQLAAVAYDLDTTKDVIVFTGSSSIRRWDDLQSYFPNLQIINTGFGGSQMSDLLHYSDQLILRHLPDKVFIYEGDNDIAAEKTPAEIMTTTLALIEKLQTTIPNIEIVLISAKPSVSRWFLRDKYKELNRRFEIYGSKKEKVNYADIWNIMLNEDGVPIKDIFLSDSLHMNKKGYDLWAKELADFLE